MSCCVCGVTIGYEVKEDSIPLCEKKECIKTFVEFFGKVCQGIDEECGMDSNGFIYNNKLICYGHFDEDFEKIWREEKERKR